MDFFKQKNPHERDKYIVFDEVRIFIPFTAILINSVTTGINPCLVNLMQTKLSIK